MNRREMRKVPKDKVGEVVQQFTDEGATQITVTPEGDGTYHVIALLP